ncbi:MAG: anaerobic glycerol-3-phosphate dehydrogenase subunit C [Candidatus Eremiobacteraeota bacterium]|nr:anaerobic glycerol-3-phosphate dehydrogenase subunit C [Candidatus Eremiobacteraeota bacterium]
MTTDKTACLEHCIKCSICHTQCPVAARVQSFPGPRQLGPELERARLAEKSLPDEIEQYLGFCINCRRCDTSCPHGVKPSVINIRNKGKKQHMNLARLRDWVLAHNVWWGSMGSMVPGPFNAMLRLAPAKFFMGMLGIAPRDFPRYTHSTLKTESLNREKKALIFPGCYGSFNEPLILQSAIDLLEACSYQVEIARTGCCGIPMLTNTFTAESRATAEKNAALLLGKVAQGFTVITTCSSCGLALKEEYGELLEEKRHLELARHVKDLFQVLADEELSFSSSKERVPIAYYHVSCHLKAQGIGTPAAALLRRAAVRELIVEDSYCCGIAGTFGFKKERFAMALDIGTPLFNAIKRSGAGLVITDCGTCTLQIADGTGITVKHPAVVLRDYLSGGPES